MRADLDSDTWTVRLRRHLAAAGDPERALRQQAYMKSALPFHGVANPALRAICKQVFADYAFDDAARWRSDVLTIWRSATHREERYAALELAADLRARPLQGLPRTARAKVPADADVSVTMALFETLIVEGAWWDHVDEIAAQRVGPLLLAQPTIARPIVRGWADDRDLWLRRAAIISQLGAKARTDLELLSETIELAIDDPSFWLRKAIGWSLREYAKTDPEWVRFHVAQLGSRLSALSRREALKHLSS